jgi:hypothetical protein
MDGFDGAIIGRDPEGGEHLIQVSEDSAGAGSITVSDDAMLRAMPVIVRLELAWQIIRAAIRLRQIEPAAEPLSSTF